MALRTACLLALALLPAAAAAPAQSSASAVRTVQPNVRLRVETLSDPGGFRLSHFLKEAMPGLENAFLAELQKSQAAGDEKRQDVVVLVTVSPDSSQTTVALASPHPDSPVAQSAYRAAKQVNYAAYSERLHRAFTFRIHFLLG